MIILGVLFALLVAAFAVWWRRRRSLLPGVLLLAFTLGPLATMALGDVLGRLWGCRVNEAGGNVCLVGGQDLGPLLTYLFTSAWFIMLTLPVGGFLLLVWFLLRLRAARPIPVRGADEI